MARPRNSAIDTFFEKALTYNGDDCLMWPFGVDESGYAQLGRLREQYGTAVVSRAICIEIYGKPPTPKHEAAHSCSNGRIGCVNRKHLRWATHKENMADDIRLENHPFQKLTEEQVLEMRRLYATGKYSRQKLSDIYCVSRHAIKNAIFGHSWSWLKEPCDAELIFDTTRPRMKDLFA